MRAARLTAQREPLKLVELPTPIPGPNEVLVRQETCGICHTDVHIRDGSESLIDTAMPLTLGHEGVGIVEAVGTNVTRIRCGERVGAGWLHDTCLDCRDCLTGHESICARQRAHGMHVDGAFSDYMLVDAAFAVRIPTNVDPLRAAPLLCAGLTAYGAILKAALRPGETCAIFGCGGLGQYAIRLARLAGARVIAIDTAPTRLAEAKRLGASHVLPSDAQTGAALRALGGADACLNFAPTAAIWPAVVAGLKNRGRFISVAMPHEPVALSLAWLTWVTPIITGTSVGGRQELADFLALAAAQDLSIAVEAVPLHAVNQALDRLSGANREDPVHGRLVIDFRL
jgi:propanol-preferring alcohol dehydrogenase